MDDNVTKLPVKNRKLKIKLFCSAYEYETNGRRVGIWPPQNLSVTTTLDGEIHLLCKIEADPEDIEVADVPTR